MSLRSSERTQLRARRLSPFDDDEFSLATCAVVLRPGRSERSVLRVDNAPFVIDNEVVGVLLERGEADTELAKFFLTAALVADVDIGDDPDRDVGCAGSLDVRGFAGVD